MATQFQHNREGKSGEWKCVIFNEPWNDNTKVYLINESQRKIATIEKGKVILKEAVEGTSEPFMVLPYDAWQSILQAMGNIVPDEEERSTNGELKATKYHLEDLRKLLKIK